VSVCPRVIFARGTATVTDSAAKELGERVREVRRAKRLTQIELAEKAGVSRDALVRLELGQRKSRASTIQKIAEALGVDADAFGVEEQSAARTVLVSAPPREVTGYEGILRASVFEGEHHSLGAGTVSRDPGVMGGAVVFAGTRVPVDILVDYLVAGDTLESFLRDFPTVSDEQAVGYLRMTPEAVGKTMSG
jgi:transcriptional regulator with XRE-family HTH domain/uncharacterized protein (DUF433 family)